MHTASKLRNIDHFNQIDSVEPQSGEPNNIVTPTLGIIRDDALRHIHLRHYNHDEKSGVALSMSKPVVARLPQTFSLLDFKLFSRIREDDRSIYHRLYPIDTAYILKVIPAGQNESLSVDFSGGLSIADHLHSDEIKRDAKKSRFGNAIYVAIALTLHLSILVPYLLNGGGTPTPLGIDVGMPENVNVSFITDADLKKLSSDPLRQATPPQQNPTPDQTAPSEPSEAVPEQTKPKIENQKTAAPIKKDIQNSDRASQFAAKAVEDFSRSLAKAFDAAAKRQKTAQPNSKNLKVYQPGAAKTGKSDEFSRSVIWALSATRPEGNGVWGTTVVTFIVSPDGHVQDLKIIKKSGDNWLDMGAMMAVKQAHIPVPPPGIPITDRSFTVEYISLNTR